MEMNRESLTDRISDFEPVRQNIETVAKLEEQFLQQRTMGDRVADAISAFTGSMACVLLHVVHGFTAAVVARIIEINPVATKKRLWRAIERLRIAYFACERAVVGEQERR